MRNEFPNTSIVGKVLGRMPTSLRAAVSRHAGSARGAKFVRAGIVTVGRHTYPQIPPIVRHLGDTASVRIGSFTSIAAGCEIFTGGEHHPEWVSSFPLRLRLDLPGKLSDGQPGSNGDIVIGSDVWLGRHTKVMSGVTIGDGAVVAAGAIVTNDVRPYAVVGGVPARLIKYRFDEAEIQGLLVIRWWDWSDQDIRERTAELSSPDVKGFVAKYLAQASSDE